MAAVSFCGQSGQTRQEHGEALKKVFSHHKIFASPPLCKVVYMTFGGESLSPIYRRTAFEIYFKENPNDYFCKRIDRRTFKLFRFEFFGAVGLRMRAALRPANPFPHSNI
jgi:hypothetical protein